MAGWSICLGTWTGRSLALAEPAAQLQILPYQEYSDPFGLTFQMVIRDFGGEPDIQADEVEAFWVPPGQGPNGHPAAPGHAETVADFRTTHFLVPGPKGNVLHVRRIPGKPAQPESRLLIRFTRPSLRSVMLFPDLPAQFQEKWLEVMLLIDESLSMKRSDPERLRVAAGRAFIDLASGGERIRRVGIIAFNHQSRRILPLADVKDKSRLFDALEEIGTVGETDMDSALDLAYQELSSGADCRKAVILLTDGKDQPGDYENAHRRFVQQGWAVHAIGLSKRADHDTLRRIATETGGSYYDAPASSDLQRVFGSICFSLERRALVKQTSAPARPDHTETVPVLIDRSIRNVTLASNAPPLTEHSLQSPQKTDTGSVVSGGKSGYQYFDLWNPAPGRWTVEARFPGTARDEWHFEAKAITPLNLWLFPLADRYEWGEPVPFSAGLAHDLLPMPDIPVDAEIIRPDGSRRRVPFSWNSPIYRGRFAETDLVGTYAIRVRACGTTREGDPFEREVTARFEVIETRTPTLWLSQRDLDFGDLYPGERRQLAMQAKLVTARAIEDQPVPWELRQPEASPRAPLPQNAITIDPAPLTVSSRKLTEFSIILAVPPGTDQGEYHSLLELQRQLPGCDFEVAEIPPVALRATVREPSLSVEPASIDLGTHQSGETCEVRFRARLHPRGRLPATLRVQRPADTSEQLDARSRVPGHAWSPEIALRTPEQVLLTTEPAEVVIPLLLGRHAAPGTRRWTLEVTAGKATERLPIQFTIEWPRLKAEPSVLDLGRVVRGQESNAHVTISANSSQPEDIALFEEDLAAARDASIELPQRLSLKPVQGQTSRVTATLPVKVSPPANARPGTYEGRFRLAAWFDRQEIQWRVVIDASKGFVLSPGLLNLAALQPGTNHRFIARLQSEVPVPQRISVRPMDSRLPEGVRVTMEPSVLELGPSQARDIALAVSVDPLTAPGLVHITYQFRGPHNSASLTLRGEVLPVPKDVPAAPSPEPEPTPPSPTFSLDPDRLDFGTLQPGQRAERDIHVTGNMHRDLSIAPIPEEGSPLRLDTATPIVELVPNEPYVLKISASMDEDAPAGEYQAWIRLRFGGIERHIIARALVEPMESAPAQIAPAPGPAAPAKPTPAPQVSSRGHRGWGFPAWARYVLWALLILAALTALVLILRWVFRVNVPDMVKFYLASGAIHILLAVLAAFYYLDTRILDPEKPDNLSVRILETLSSQPEETVSENPDTVPSVTSTAIEVQRDETGTVSPLVAPPAAQEHKQPQPARETPVQPRPIELRKELTDVAQSLAATAPDDRKQETSAHRKVEPPSLSVTLHTVETPQEAAPEATATPADHPRTESSQQRTKARTILDPVSPPAIRPERDVSDQAPDRLASWEPEVIHETDAQPAAVAVETEAPEQKQAEVQPEPTPVASPTQAQSQGTVAPQSVKQIAQPTPVEIAQAPTQPVTMPQQDVESPSLDASGGSVDAASMATGGAASPEETDIAVPMPAVKGAARAAPAAAAPQALPVGQPGPVALTAAPRAKTIAPPTHTSPAQASPSLADLSPGAQGVAAAPLLAPESPARSPEYEKPSPAARAHVADETLAAAQDGPVGDSPARTPQKSPRGKLAEGDGEPCPATVATSQSPAPTSRRRQVAAVPNAPTHGSGASASPVAAPALPTAHGTDSPEVISGQTEFGKATVSPATISVAENRPVHEAVRRGLPQPAQNPLEIAATHDDNTWQSTGTVPANPSRKRPSRFADRSGVPFPSVLGPTQETDSHQLLSAFFVPQPGTSDVPPTTPKASSPGASPDIAVPAPPQAMAAKAIALTAASAQPSETLAGQTLSASAPTARRNRSLAAIPSSPDVPDAAGTLVGRNRTAPAPAAPGTWPSSGPSSSSPGRSVGSPEIESIEPPPPLAGTPRRDVQTTPGPDRPPMLLAQATGPRAAQPGQHRSTLTPSPLPVQPRTEIGLSPSLSAATLPAPRLSSPAHATPRFIASPARRMTRFTTYLAQYRNNNEAFDDRQLRSMRFLADEIDRRLDFILSADTRIIRLERRNEVLSAPWLFLTGEFEMQFTDAEIRNLQDFIRGGGWLWVEDCTRDTDSSFDRTFRDQMKRILPGTDPEALPMDHPIFQIAYDLSRGYMGYEIPPGDKYRENRIHAWAIDGRPAVVYTRNDYGCGLEIDTKTYLPSRASLTDLTPPEMQNASVMMSMNVLFYFLGGWSPVQELSSHVADAARKDAETRRIHALKFQNLFLKGAILPAFEDFESDTASFWQVIGEDQITETTWKDLDPATGRIVEDRTGRALEMAFPLRKGKSAVERLFTVPLDLSDSHALLMDIENQSPALTRLAVAFATGPDYEYFESPPLYIKPGLNRNVLVTLFSEHFKSEKSEWAFRSKLQNTDDIRKILFIAYAVRPGTLRFDNLRFSRVRREDLQELLIEARNEVSRDNSTPPTNP